MSVDRCRQGQSRRHQEGGPVHCVEPKNVLADDMDSLPFVLGPVLFEEGSILASKAQRTEVVR